MKASGESADADRLRMPRARKKFPSALLTTTIAANSRVFHFSRRSNSIRSDAFFGARLLNVQHAGPLIGDVLPALGAKAEKVLGFLVKALALRPLENSLADDAPGGLGTEIIFAVEPLHPIHELGFIENAGIDYVRQLMTFLVRHINLHQVIRFGVVVEFGARIGVRDGHLNRLGVQALGKVDRVPQRLASLPRKADNEITVNHQSQLVAVGSESLGHVHGRALLD